MQTKTLFSQHYLENRLPDHPEWEEDPRAVFEAVRDLWERARKYGDTWNESQTEQEFIQPMLELLGWEYMVQPKAHQGGRVKRPDYALFPDEEAKDDAMPHQGDDAAFYSQASAIAEAKYWGRPLSQKDTGGRETWDAQTNPSYQMVSYLVGTHVGWGILTNGLTWRLYSREVSSTASEYYEIDLGLIFDSLPDDGEPSEGPLDRFRRWWLFFRQRSFVPDAEGRSFVERVHGGSDTYARRISDTLKKLVYEEVMPEIAGGFAAYRYQQRGVRDETDESLRQIYRASLSLLYKLLFLLYGEARALLPVDNPGYREQSVTALAQWAAERIDKGLAISDATHATGRYDSLQALFRRIDQGDPSLGIPRYDGGLFDPSSPENRFLEEHGLSDQAVARAVDTLVRDAGEPVDYAYIGVQNLGSIYEGLLENRLRVVDAAAGKVELVGDQGERKATGSYYTPDYIVQYIVQHTLDPILEDRDEVFRGAMDRCAKLRGQLKKVSDRTTGRRLRHELDKAERDAREAFLGIKVLDPAMGSGHFLVNAVDHLTDDIIRRMQVYHDQRPDFPWNWNPIQRLIEQVREAVLTEMKRQSIQVDRARLDDTALLTRLVMKRCIYGVDLNRMAVELAKVSLWLHTFTVGAPLSFLDHHLRWGNSLIGTDVQTVEDALYAAEQRKKVSEDARRLARGRGEPERKIATAYQRGLFAGPFAGLLDLTGLMVEVVERADATLADVEQSAKAFKQFRKELTPYKQVLDLWVSQYFGNELAEEFLTVQGDAVVPALKGNRDVPEQYQQAIAEARQVYEEKRFFHWDLEFPEVFVDLRKRDWTSNPGFDIVIGNPPYFSVSTLPAEDVGFLKQAYSEVFTGNSDILYYFLGQVGDLPKRGGLFGMIVGRYFQEAKYAAKLREHLAKTANLIHLVDFGNFQVFGSEVNVLASVVILQRQDGHYDDQRAEILRLKAEDAPAKKVAKSLLQGDELFEAFLVTGPGRHDTWNFTSPMVARISSKIVSSSILLGKITRVVQSMQTGRNEILAPDNSILTDHAIEDELIHPIAKAGSIERYEFEELGNSIIWTEGIDLDDYPNAKSYLSPFKEELASRYDIRNRGANWWEISNPRNAHLFFSDRPRILVPFIATGNKFCVDTRNRLNDGGDIRGVFFDADSTHSEYYVCGILNSGVCEYYHLRHTKLKRGGYYEYFEGQLSELPVPRVAFTTSPEDRQRLTRSGTSLAVEWIEANEGASVESVSFGAFYVSDLGRWLDERLSPVHTPDPELVRKHNNDPLNEDCQLPEEGPVEQSDVVHNLLANLAEQMIEMHKERQSFKKALDPFKYLDRGASFVPFIEAFNEEIKWGQRIGERVELGAVHHDIDGLRLEQVHSEWELQVQLKKRDPKTGWEEWQYKGEHSIAREWVPAYRLPLDEQKARYYQHAFQVRDDFAEAGAFPGGYTRSTEKKLRLAGVPAYDEEADLAPLVKLNEDLTQVKARIAATDRLIDFIVYRLYGLSEEEVAVIEGESP